MNAFEKMLREKIGLTEAFELVLVHFLEQILGPATQEKADKLYTALTDKENHIVDPAIVATGEAAVRTYCKAKGYFGGLKEDILKAAEIVKSQTP